MSGNANQGGASSTPNTTDWSKMPKRRSSSTWIAVVAVIVVVVAVLVYGYSAGWLNSKSGKSAGCGAGQTVTGAGSSFVYPLMYSWSLTYANQGCAQVNYASVGSGAGITELTQKVVDFGASDAPLKPTQRAALTSAAFTIPETLGAVTIVYNIPGVAKGLNLTGQIVASIYLGTITNWNTTEITTLNPGVKIPNLAISVVYRSDASGTSYVFTSYLSKSNATWASKVGSGTSVVWPVGSGWPKSAGVSGEVLSTKGAIGYVELNYAATGGLAYAALQNPAGSYILPNATNTAQAAAAVASSLPAGSGDWGNVSMIDEPGQTTYPLATFSYVMVYADLGGAYGSSMTPGHAQALVSFLWWIVHTGQAGAQGLFYVPLPSSVVTLDESTIGAILYNGATIQSH